ncbi:MAG: AmmeMemoRadiSam system protein B [Nitrospirae bacterium]|nr:AmmeMemoRadiSam system protein B [Nitrospirota bacterium]
MRRAPAVAGYFYPKAPEQLRRQVGAFLQVGPQRRSAVGLLVPHAGIVYSGSVAGAVYSRARLRETVVLLGPNHTGLGARVAVMTSGVWEMPGGSVEIDAPFAETVLERARSASGDYVAHLREHSLEMQIPFLQLALERFRIVPVVMLAMGYEVCRDLGEAIAAASEALKKPVTIVASSDMTHYEQDAEARRKDRMALDRILALDPEGLHRVIREEGISMCGYGPAVAMLVAAKRLGGTEAELIRYATSGEVSGDYEQVVGYAGAAVWAPDERDRSP